MNSKKLIVVPSLIIGSVVLLLAGYFVGSFVEKQQIADQFDESTRAIDTLKALGSSKIVPSIVAYGTVTNISGRDIELSDGEDNLVVSMKDGAKISLVSAPTTGVAGQNNVDFSAIKIGDKLNISLIILADGRAEGSSVIIYPPATGVR